MIEKYKVLLGSGFAAALFGIGFILRGMRKKGEIKDE